MLHRQLQFTELIEGKQYRSCLLKIYVHFYKGKQTMPEYSYVILGLCDVLTLCCGTGGLEIKPLSLRQEIYHQNNTVLDYETVHIYRNSLTSLLCSAM